MNIIPGLDGTGPEGKGKMTGRGFGVCNNYYKPLASTPKSTPKHDGSGRGRRANRGRGGCKKNTKKGRGRNRR